ncbi:MAG: hypothetical protein H7196_01590 [candidate division SR1 bacterium]|nr:hypothetical protein [candidate division SR1 bacterium]
MITKIGVKNYGTGYTSVPIVVIIPINGGTSVVATTKIIETGSNINPANFLAEDKISATLDPSIGTISKIKSNLITNSSNFVTGSKALITDPAVQHTLFSNTSIVP